MKRICLLFFLVSTFFLGFSQPNIGLAWAKGFASNTIEKSKSIVTDPAGNVYFTGSFSGQVDFDPGPNVFNLTTNGNADIFVQKLNANGNFLWAVSMGGFANDAGVSMCLDQVGNVYVAGNFGDTVDFDPGPGVYNLTGAPNYTPYFILKLDPNGNFIWVKSGQGIYTSVMGGIAADPFGNLFIGTNYRGTIDVDPGPNMYNMPVTVNVRNSFILKLDTAGNFIWAKLNEGTSYFNVANAITSDKFGNVIMTGEFGQTTDFDPGPNVYNVTVTSGFAAFLQKLDSAGNFLWANTIRSSNSLDVKTDSSANVFTTGTFNQIADFDPGPATLNFTPLGGTDVYLQKLDPLGNLAWAIQIGGIGRDVPAGISLDDSNNVFIGGSFENQVDFDPSATVNSIISNGSSDAFAAKYSALGQLKWAESIGGIYNDYCSTIWSDPFGAVHLSGTFRGTVDFHAGLPVYDLLSQGGIDAVFVAKWRECFPISTIDTIVACDSYMWIDSVTYTSSNQTAVHQVVNSFGCDSLVRLNLTILQGSTGVDSIVACDSLTWINGITYLSDNNTAQFTLTASNGCDSVVRLDLKLLNSQQSTDTVVACNNYTWIDGNTYFSNNNTASHTLQAVNGCDSTVYLFLRIQYPDDTVEFVNSCGPFTWIDGNTYTANNTSATHVLTNTHGCDSTVHLNLIVYSVDTLVNRAGFTLMANASAANYQWLNCSNGYMPVVGATAQSFTPSIPGSYAVIVIQNGCRDTSACHLFTTVGRNEPQNQNDISFNVFPNPSTGSLTLQLSEFRKPFLIEISNSLGQIVSKEIGRNLETQLDLPLASGIYFLKVTTEKGSKTVKILRE